MDVDASVLGDPLAKRARVSVDAGEAASKGGLTEEQRLRIEQNRLRALERKKQQQEQQNVPTPQQQNVPTPQQVQPVQADKLKTIEQNRLAALARRQQKQQIEVVAKTESEAEKVVQNAAADDAKLDSEESSSAASSSSSDSDSESDSEASSDSDASTMSSSSSPASQDPAAAVTQASTGETEAASVGALSEEQRKRMEQNRLAALAKKTLEEQRKRIEQNRLAALAKKSFKQEAKVSKKSSGLAALLCLKTDVMDKTEKDDIDQRRKVRDEKQALVAKLLCRWWYVLPAWPPEDDSFYEPILSERRLRVVAVEQFESEPDQDERGFSKVFGVTCYNGLFRDMQGNLLDLRPQETCPSYNNMMLKSVPELHALLITAYGNQLAELEALPLVGTDHSERRIALLKEVKDARHKARFRLMFAPKGNLSVAQKQ